MRGGKFPKDHPCAGAAKPFCFESPAADDSPLGRFRSLGYWASCFPEGDGITMKAPDAKTPEQVMQDIRDCFGWEVWKAVGKP